MGSVEKEFICMKEAATLMGVSARTAKKAIDNMESVNYIKVGNKLLVNKKKLEQYLNTEKILRY